MTRSHADRRFSSRYVGSRFDPDSRAIDRTFRFTNLIETAGTGVYGIELDGTSIWISVSGNTNKLVRVDSRSGAITKSMSSPTTLGPSDLALDGTDLVLSSGTGLVFGIDRETGGVQSRLDPWLSGTRQAGVAYRAGEIWVAGLFGGITAYNRSQEYRGAATIDGASPTQAELGAMTFAGSQLVILSTYGITYYDVSSDAGTCGPITQGSPR